MKTKTILLMLLAFLWGWRASAQNPYEDLGIEAKPLTLSKGKYEEFFDQDSVVRIGNALFNVRTERVVGFVEEDTAYSEATLQPEVSSRWLSVDPLAEEFPGWSPYVFANDNPIVFIDPDGRAPVLPGGGDEPGGDDDASIDNWRPFDSNRIRRLAYLSGVNRKVKGDKIRFNQTVGLAFERVISDAFGIPKNSKDFPTDVRKKHSNVRPDFVYQTRYTNIEVFLGFIPIDYQSGTIREGTFGNHPDIDFWEAKSGYEVGLEDNDSQIRGMIDVLGNMENPVVGKPIKEAGGGFLYIITPANTNISPQIGEFATSNGVAIYQVEAYEHPSIDGFIRFRAPIPLNPSVLNVSENIVKSFIDSDAGKRLMPNSATIRF